MRESTYLKTLTTQKFIGEFERFISHTWLREMELNLSEIRESSRSFGCHSPQIMREMEKWFEMQRDNLLKAEQRWIEYVRENALFDEEAEQNLRFVNMGVRNELEEKWRLFNARKGQIEEAKQKFVDTELRLIILRKKEEKEAFEEYITQVEYYYDDKLKIWLYERLAAMLANIDPIMRL